MSGFINSYAGMAHSSRLAEGRDSSTPWYH